MRQIMLILLFSAGGMSYGESGFYTAQNGFFEGAEQPRFKLRGYITPPDGYNPKNPKVLEDIDYPAPKRALGQAEWNNLLETDRKKEMLEIQAVYEKMSLHIGQGTGQGIVIRWSFGQNQGDFSHGRLPGSLTIAAEDPENEAVAQFFGQMVRPYREKYGKSRLESSWGADFPQKGGENLETGRFFSFSREKLRYNGLGALYEKGMIGKDEPGEIGEIREKYDPFGQFAGTAIEWAEISGVWTADEPKDSDNQEAIHYFEFSEPIGGGGGGGGALLAPYRKMEGGAYLYPVEPIPFSYIQPRGGHWGNSLNYGENPASMAVSPSRSFGNGRLSGSWGGSN